MTEVRVTMADTEKCSSPKPDFAGGRAIVWDGSCSCAWLRGTADRKKQLDKMGSFGPDVCEEPISTRWQLDLTEASKMCATRLIRRQRCVLIEDPQGVKKHVTNTSCRKEWQSSSDNVCRAGVHSVRWTNGLHDLWSHGDVTERGRDIVVGTCQAGRDIAEFQPWTSIHCSNISTWSLDLRDGWDLSLPEQGAAIHHVLQQVRPQLLVAGSLQNWACDVKRSLFKRYRNSPEDETVTISSATVVPADGSVVEMRIWTHSPEVGRLLPSRCDQDGSSRALWSRIAKTTTERWRLLREHLSGARTGQTRVASPAPTRVT